VALHPEARALETRFFFKRRDGIRHGKRALMTRTERFWVLPVGRVSSSLTPRSDRLVPPVMEI
jgi:hypothetical protein